MKKIKIGLALMMGSILLFVILSINLSIKSGTEDGMSIRIAKNLAKANEVYGCCKEDAGDSCNAYGTIVSGCDECFWFANCNKEPEQ